MFKLQLKPKDIAWRYWVASEVLLILGLLGFADAFYLVIALAAVQILHFSFKQKSMTAFPVQVRMALLLILLVATWPPMRWLFWLPAIGLGAAILFDYCLMARALTLFPWNRKQPLSKQLIKKTFFSPPVSGSVEKGFPVE